MSAFDVTRLTKRLAKSQLILLGRLATGAYCYSRILCRHARLHPMKTVRKNLVTDVRQRVAEVVVGQDVVVERLLMPSLKFDLALAISSASNLCYQGRSLPLPLWIR